MAGKGGNHKSGGMQAKAHATLTRASRRVITNNDQFDRVHAKMVSAGKKLREVQSASTSTSKAVKRHMPTARSGTKAYEKQWAKFAPVAKFAAGEERRAKRLSFVEKSHRKSLEAYNDRRRAINNASQ